MATRFRLRVTWRGGLPSGSGEQRNGDLEATPCRGSIPPTTDRRLRERLLDDSELRRAGQTEMRAPRSAACS